MGVTWLEPKAHASHWALLLLLLLLLLLILSFIFFIYLKKN
jgi:hypothetical protein